VTLLVRLAARFTPTSGLGQARRPEDTTEEDQSPKYLWRQKASPSICLSSPRTSSIHGRQSMQPFVENGLYLRSRSDLERLVPNPGSMGVNTGEFGNAGLGGGRTARSTRWAATRPRLPSGPPIWSISMIAGWVLLRASRASRQLRYTPGCRHQHATDGLQRLDPRSNSRGEGANSAPPAIRLENMSVASAGLQNRKNRCSSVFVYQTSEAALF
jgi:hypothetical protein